MNETTPLVDAALEEAMRRLYHTQQFEKGGIPKEFADFARRLERALAGAEKAMQTFVNRRDSGEIRSNRSYADFKAALAQIEELRK